MADEPKRYAVATVPKEQCVRYRITPEPGKYMNADNVGKQMSAIAGLFKAASREDGIRVAVCLTEAVTMPDGSLEFVFAILRFPDARRQDLRQVAL